MRYLRKRAAMMSLYHGTTLTSLMNIVNVGLQPDAQSIWNERQDKTSLENGVFLTDNEETATFYAREKWLREGASLNNYLIILTVAVSSDRLQPDNDDPSITYATWEESLAEIYQVYVEGAIVPSDIHDILFFANDGTELGTYSLATFAQDIDGTLRILKEKLSDHLQDGFDDARANVLSWLSSFCKHIISAASNSKKTNQVLNYLNSMVNTANETLRILDIMTNGNCPDIVLIPTQQDNIVYPGFQWGLFQFNANEDVSILTQQMTVLKTYIDTLTFAMI